MTTFNIKQANLENLPLSNLYATYRDADNKDQALAEFSKFLDLKKKPWFLPQLLAHFPRKFPAKVSKVQEGKFSLEETLGSMTDSDRALYFIAQDAKRGNYVSNMGNSPEFSALVPLLLAGYKKHAGINYLQWDKPSLSLGIPDPLLACINVDLNVLIKELNTYAEYNYPEMDTIKKYRDTAYLDLMRALKTDFNAGTGYTLSMTKTPFASSETRLLRYIELQAWVGHPKLRNKYMILNIRDLDDMPEPLVVDKVLLEMPLKANHPFLK